MDPVLVKYVRDIACAVLHEAELQRVRRERHLALAGGMPWEAPVESFDVDAVIASVLVPEALATPNRAAAFATPTLLDELRKRGKRSKETDVLEAGRYRDMLDAIKKFVEDEKIPFEPDGDPFGTFALAAWVKLRKLKAKVLRENICLEDACRTHCDFVHSTLTKVGL